MGEADIIQTRRGPIVVFYLDNPFPIDRTGIDVYPNGTVLLYEKGDRFNIHDKAVSGVRVDRFTAEAVDRGRTLVVEVEASKPVRSKKAKKAKGD